MSSEIMLCMSIETCPKVVLYARMEGKYVLAELKELHSKRTATVVLGGSMNGFYRDLVQLLRENNSWLGLTERCIGGGKYRIDDNERTVLLWGSSKVFGTEPNREVTIQLFQSAFPEFTVRALSTDEADTLGLS